LIADQTCACVRYTRVDCAVEVSRFEQSRDWSGFSESRLIQSTDIFLSIIVASISRIEA